MSGYWLKLLCSKGGWVTLSANFKGKGRRPPTNVGVKKLVTGLSRGVVCVILRLVGVIQYRRATDRHTDTHTHTDIQTMTANTRTLLARWKAHCRLPISDN